MYTMVEDISAIGELVNLTGLLLYGNRIEDIKPIANLVELDYLDLRDNHIVDISPLINNVGLGDGDEIRLKDNPLSTASINEYIPQLTNKGVSIDLNW